MDVVLASFKVVKRDGTLVPFDRERIFRAVQAAFKATYPSKDNLELIEKVEHVTGCIISMIIEFLDGSDACPTVEGIQDIAEVVLMREGHHEVAKNYILYRDRHKQLREGSVKVRKVVRRDGSQAQFSPMKIVASLERVFREARNVDGPSSPEILSLIHECTQGVVKKCDLQKGLLDVQQIHLFLEEELMERKLLLELRISMLLDLEKEGKVGQRLKKPRVARKKIPNIASNAIKARIRYACRGLAQVNMDALYKSVLSHFYEGMSSQQIDKAILMAARIFIERRPVYSKVASRILLDILYVESIGCSADDEHLDMNYREYFKKWFAYGVEIGRLDPRLLEYDLVKLSNALVLERDDQFSLLGLQTLYDRYFIHEGLRKLEAPQIFWMRVAMGLALNETNKEEAAISFYNVLSKFLFMVSTPTLFNSGTTRPQLSSCYLSTVQDDLDNIFKTLKDNAMLSKWAGGLGNDWTNVRATGSHIHGTNGKSQGVIPFLKVANDGALAVNQGGKRKGALSCYLETWHLDIELFLELRKNTGDERRRAHDMHTANWIPDLFMKRVLAEGEWTLFSPSDVPDLHDLYGGAFEVRYQEYEEQTRTGKITHFKRVSATVLWRKMLGYLFETGHPWITFKDACNIRSPQDHCGVIHCSNLCTEITLNTSQDEVAVCNLGSVNLPAHMKNGEIDHEKLKETVFTAVRMLDNVIDLNFYPIIEAKNSNLRHRPIGLGMMGFQDALYMRKTPYASHEAVQFADESTEILSYYAIMASAHLAEERGAYSSYAGSKWDRGIFPIDTLDLLEKERGGHLEIDLGSVMDWRGVRQRVKKHGMRNSNVLAFAPTATIANIISVTQSIEPMYTNLFVKSNLSGDFICQNTALVSVLDALGLWDDEMIDDLKYFDGSVQEIDRVPQDVRELFKTAFEISPEWLVECNARRQKWIDQAIAANAYVSRPDGKTLSNLFFLSWRKGLKTNYYLRSLAATQVEKSNADVNARGIQPRWMSSSSASGGIKVSREDPSVCSLEDGCESCQ